MTTPAGPDQGPGTLSRTEPGADPGHDARPAPAHFNPLEAADRQRARLLTIVRVVFVFVLLSVTLLRILGVTKDSEAGEKELLRLWYFTLGLAVVLGLAAVVVDLLTKTKKIAMLTGILAGILMGLIATAAISFIIDLLATTYGFYPAFTQMVKVLLGICLCYLGASVVLQTQDDFRLVIPYVEFAKEMRGVRPLVIDTSALIDGRIAELAGTGLLQAPLVIPRFVVLELQTLADSADKLRRARGRRGLEIVGKLQRLGKVDVTIDPKLVPGQGVDQMITELARQLAGLVLTTDSGLARVAGIQGVRVLNLHELANAVRPPLLPGEPISIAIVKPGEQPGQGVGYLDDGTMVVVERAREYVGEIADAEVVSWLQTSAGRMVFAKLAGRLSDGQARELPEVEPVTSGALPAPVESVPEAIAPDHADHADAAFDTDDHAAAEDDTSDPAAHQADPRSTPAPRPLGPFPPNPPRRSTSPRNPRR